MVRRAPRRAPRRVALLGLTAAVLLLHLLLLAFGLPAPGAAGAAERPLRRLEVAFVRELAPAAPPPAPATSPLRRLRSLRAVSAAAGAASSALPPVLAVQEAGAEAGAELARLLEALPELAALDAVPGSAPPDLTDLAGGPVPAGLVEPPAPIAAQAAASAPGSGPAFDWPPSTRLSYVLTGHYRGPVDGHAQVEWLRQGTRYQVHLDLGIGPSFAYFVSRRISSEGEITDQGLHPLRYDEETRVALREPRRLRITLGADRIDLPGGRSQPRPQGVQDSASQFVQMTWMFTLQPDLLQAGRQLVLPLALPRQVEDWTYEVVGPETLVTPMGTLDTVHVKPRRQPRPGVDLTAELWFAPSLQYLPVRIVVRHDDQTHVDLLLDRLPQQAAEPGR